MHYEVLEWFRGVYHEHPGLFHGKRVLECGALVPFVGVRMFFNDCPDYTGLDCRPGRSVDVVGLVHEYEPEAPFGVVVSAQMLEHDPYWRQSLARMVELLEPGGALILSWAGPGWARHDLEATPTLGYYENRTVDEVLEVIGPDAFDEVQTKEQGRDLFLVALGRKESP